MEVFFKCMQTTSNLYISQCSFFELEERMNVKFLHGKPCACFHRKEIWLLGYLSGGQGLSPDTRLQTQSAPSQRACHLSLGSVCGIHPLQVCTVMFTRKRLVTSRTVSIRNTKIQFTKVELYSCLVQSEF